MVTKEPAIVFGALGEVAKAIVPVLILGGFVIWDEKMVAAVMFLISILVTSLSSVFIRSQSVSTEQANKQIGIALKADPSTSVKEVVEAAK